MRSAPVVWQDEYAPFLGAELEDVAFLSLRNSDTPGVVASLDEDVIAFSGAVQLVFAGGRPFYLTWRQETAWEFGLEPVSDIWTSWTPHSLDTIHRSSSEAWENALGGARLKCVSLYSSDLCEDQSFVTAIAHRCETTEKTSTLWISAASGANAGPGDDLIVSLDKPPPSTGSLIPLGIVQ